MIPLVVDLLVSHCPHLESLTIMIESDHISCPNVDNLFLLGKWPKLRILQLKNISLSPTHAMRVALRSFFPNNLTIRHLVCFLYTDDDYNLNIILPPNCLPHLTFLYAGNQMIKAILSCPCSPPRPLEKLRGLTLDRALCQQSDSNFQGNKDALLAVKISGIQRLDYLQLLGMLFPCIEYLELSTTIYFDDAGYIRRLSMKGFARFRILERYTESPSSQMIWKKKLKPELYCSLIYFLDLYFLTGQSMQMEIIRGADGLTWRTTYSPWLAFHIPDPYMIEEQ
ncbi:hypothetical protein JB92DRAFT_3026111 [Gautieria morchelliformis]|nr:hypothetical protein JB92DRAFT_3026111 [Gautieria morchelliformis]